MTVKEFIKHLEESNQQSELAFHDKDRLTNLNITQIITTHDPDGITNINLTLY